MNRAGRFRLAGCLAAAALLVVVAGAGSAQALSISVSGNHLVNGQGKTRPPDRGQPLGLGILVRW